MLPLVILTSGLLVFAAFSLASRALFDQTEQRLLQERTDEASASLAVSVGQIKTPLSAAATLAQITDGDAAAFQQAMNDYVGEGKSFTSAALYAIDSTEPIVTVGAPIGLHEGDEQRVQALLAAAQKQPFVVVDLLDRGRRLGYGVADSSDNPHFVVYGERTLGADPNVRRRNDEPFAELDYAIYLGDTESNTALLGASVRDLPIDGRRASSDSPFGDQHLRLVMTPIGHLSSGLFADLWWIVALIGATASITVAALSRRLIVRHHEALVLAQDNERLYDEQRTIAETLQLSLLPQVLEPPPGAEVAARYWPAGTASLIGGDFYDVFRVDDARWAVTIGDVCGKGIEAAAVTGLARHTVRAAARYSTSASDVLHAVHQAMFDHRPATFCTVCFVYIGTSSTGAQQLNLSLGGHPPALLRRAGGTVEEIGALGTLLGIVPPQLTDVTIDVAPGDTLVLYTDGLTDAPPGQAVPIAEVMQLLRTAGDQSTEQLADSIRALKRGRRPHGSSDDTVVLILRFGDPAQSSDARAAAGTRTAALSS
ncbi:MAG: putative serine/threonine protein phosphatase [Ilumatobacteraceae bacterium]|nr:putative serine/threonine protein phosphatase [Ilumatobacteraceae bacterium]